MKKQLKRIGALALALIFALCLMLPVFAEDPSDGEEEEPAIVNTGTGSITINGVKTGKSYAVFRIFDLTFDEPTGDTTAENATKTGYSYTVASNWKDFFFNADGLGKDYLVEKTDTNKDQYAESNELTYNNKTYFINISETNVVSFAQAALAYVASNWSSYWYGANIWATLSTDSGKLTVADTDWGCNDYEVTEDEAYSKNYISVSHVDEGDYNSLKFSNVALGYYLVYPVGASVAKSDKSINAKGSIGSLDTTDKDMEVWLKAEYPTIKKETNEPSTVVQAGSQVSFTITGTVPDTTGYSKYSYEIHDTLGKDLQYTTSDSFTITILKKDDNGEDLDITNDAHLVEKDETGKFNCQDTAKIYFGSDTNADTADVDEIDKGKQWLHWTIDATQYQVYKGQTIKITYTATVKADTDGKNIVNHAELEYSNDPSDSSSWEKGVTTTDDVKLYTVNVQVYAYAAPTNEDDKAWAPGTALPDAQYVLQRQSDGKYYTWNKDNGVEWVESIDDALHLVTGQDGLTKEITASDANSESTAGSTSESTSTSNQTSDTSQPAVASDDENDTDETLQANDNSAVTSETGTGTETAPVASATFKGLAAGDYTLKEVVTPAGYNTAVDTPIVVRAKTKDDEKTDQEAIAEGGLYIESDNIYTYQYNVEHKSGSKLPSTGGMGTTLFYVIGASLLIGAGVLLVVRRRMGDEE